MKLVRLLAKHRSLGSQAASRALAGGRVTLNDAVVTEANREVTRFDHVRLDGEVLQTGCRALYLMLHKPSGIVSATHDPAHRTVIDLIDDPDRETLHLAGRLDRSTTGLMLLTNDGAWSKRITEKAFGITKTYLVQTRDPMDPAIVRDFARGFYFATENITTQPAELTLLDSHHARLTLSEGRYHQIKRMFHRVQNRVTALHREAIGPIQLPHDLPPGHWRPLTPAERDSILRRVFNEVFDEVFDEV